MKKIFKILGVLIILAIGTSLVFYGNANRNPSKAERAYNYGDFKTAELFYSISKIPFIQREIENISLARTWSFYYQGYFEPEKYGLAEGIINQELQKEKFACKDQFYNLKALINWQKAVGLFIELGKKKALRSKELGQFLNEARTSSEEAVSFNDGNDRDIKYNYEFFHKKEQELKQNMQQQAEQKQKNKEIKGKMEQKAEEKKIKPNPKEGQQEQGEGKKKSKVEKESKEKKESKINTFVPEKKKGKSEKEETPSDNEKKKKKKG